jgi:dihydropteroate synthase
MAVRVPRQEVEMEAAVREPRPAEPEMPRRRSLDPSLDIAPADLWLRPLALLSGEAARAARGEGRALKLAGGASAFLMVELLGRLASGEVVSALGSLAELQGWAQRRGGATVARVASQLERLAAPRAPWAGLALDRPLIMGIVNTTPDSFSDGGRFLAPERAIAHGRALAAAGADILDVGGESTRPGAAPVAPEEELRRVEPVVRALAGAGFVVSIDTRHARTMAAALAAGARIINDVSALAGDPESLAVAARSGAAVALMHMQGEPPTMQANPTYSLASLDIVEYLEARIAACAAAGIARSRLIVDPGIGFGKRAQHNLEIMARLGLLHALGCGVLLGISRKSLIAELHKAEPSQRIPGSLAGALQALAQGVQVLRVHDVAETRQAVATWRAVAGGA